VVKRIDEVRKQVEDQQTRSCHQSREILDACKKTAKARLKEALKEEFGEYWPLLYKD
jgi:hypothetical protein